jgi:hypothetical protein
MHKNNSFKFICIHLNSYYVCIYLYKEIAIHINVYQFTKSIQINFYNKLHWINRIVLLSLEPFAGELKYLHNQFKVIRIKLVLITRIDELYFVLICEDHGADSHCPYKGTPM